jgi:phosphoribosylformylglycinamidine synthase
LAQEIDFDLIKSNFAKFEAIQADHKVTSASAVKYGGVVEALALATFGNHIGATVTLENIGWIRLHISGRDFRCCQDWTNSS